MSFISLTITSFILGIVHGFDADHIAAVTNFISKDPDPKRATMFGLKFGVGHFLTVLILGIITLIFKFTISEVLAGWLEVLAGISLIGLGVWLLWGLYKNIHIHSHTHQEEEHTHFHLHGAKTKQHLHRHGATWLGIIMGLAGTAGVMLFGPVILASSLLEAGFYITIYGIGVIIAMGLYSFIISKFYRIFYRNRRFSKVVLAGTGIFSIFLGLFIIITEGSG